jgi:transcriptional regulator with XRE-family HTH domain
LQSNHHERQYCLRQHYLRSSAASFKKTFVSTAAIEPFYKELGRRVRDQRSKRGLTQDDLANRISPSVTRAAIANIEGGKQRVLCHTLWQLAQALGVTPLDLAPLPGMPSGSAATRRAVESELEKNLDLSKTAIKKLAARIPRPPQEGVKP